jgi:aminoglycoside phosphotransferase (APT) family kinase protein
MTVPVPAVEQILDVELRAWVEGVVGTAVEGSEPLGKGSSRRIWLVHAGGRHLVVREDTGTGPVAGTALDLAREGAVYRALAGAGQPVPRLHAVHPGGRALLLEHAPGVERLDGIDAASRRAVVRDFGRRLGALHLVEVDDVELGPLTRPADDRGHATDDIDLWAGIQRTRTGEHATPVAAFALATLRDLAPGRATRTSLCHGDAGPGNVLHDGERVTALLDWEFAHVGDPHDDLAWVAVRNEVLRHPLDLADVYGVWRERTGLAIDRRTLEFYRALVLARMLVSCDATVCWAGGERDAPAVQVMLRPYLGAALVEALRRAGAGGPALDRHDEPARARWAASPIASVLGDPSMLDDHCEVT